MQKWFSIGSDPELETQINDRIYFKKFLGLTLEQPSPDHSTFSRFRDRLSAHQMILLSEGKVDKNGNALKFSRDIESEVPEKQLTFKQIVSMWPVPMSCIYCIKNFDELSNFQKTELLLRNQSD
jgi:hypothetical protein